MIGLINYIIKYITYGYLLSWIIFIIISLMKGAGEQDGAADPQGEQRRRDQAQL